MSAVKVIITILALLFAAVGAAYQFWLKPQIEFAQIGTAYGAKKMCSCLNVSELSLDQCKADFTEDISMVTFIPDKNAVTVEVLGGRISNRAIYRPGLGCTLVTEKT
ncbi:hypothetical protein GCM10007853_05150 [Algimonas ampicilliniresistens]|uniref:Uncharacterized protein n=1 Tax=Algimonas ampicilliniresistens TaxID=1298735 RepID=A0ABQ5V7T2_9PROT|nr:hypothetical protein [Algimonas ampicilliniresistens]GLQ22641.1 hypothetical protein GCM10007853_05150 [Algimonas ampicilliniresistens]